MKCPVCYFKDTKVLDSRVASDGLCIRRRRQCLKCGFRFSTYEEIEILDLIVIKKDGNREIYNREKMVSGLKKALEKRPVDGDKFKKLIHCIERDIQKTKKDKISSGEIGEIIMKHLKKIDQVAYIRYASVYKSFKDADEFREELNELPGKRKK
jgi:transcriptional repressor NrdR